MGRWQGKSRKKPTGGRRWPKRKKRQYELGGESAETRIGDRKQVRISVRGKEGKLKLLSADKANITNMETGDSVQAKINSVIENPADPHLVRRNIITKNAVIDTEFGKARVTSRPGQSGVVNAVSLEEKLERKILESEAEPEEDEVEEERLEEETEEKTGKEEESEDEVKEDISSEEIESGEKPIDEKGNEE